MNRRCLFWAVGLLVATGITGCGGGGGNASNPPSSAPPTSRSVKVSLDPSIPTTNVAQVISPYGSSPLSSSGSAVVPLPTSVINPVVVVAINSTGNLLAAGTTSGNTLTLNATTTATVLVRIGIGALPSNVTVSQVNSQIQSSADFQTLVSAVQSNLTAGTPPGASSSVMAVLPKVITESILAIKSAAGAAKSAVARQTVEAPLPYSVLVMNVGNVDLGGVSVASSAQNEMVLSNELQVYFSAQTTSLNKNILGTASVAPTNVFNGLVGLVAQTNVTTSGSQFFLTVSEDNAAKAANITQVTVNAVEMIMQVAGVSTDTQCGVSIANAIVPASKVTLITETGNFNSYFNYLENASTYSTIANDIGTQCGISVSIQATGSLAASFIPILGQIYDAYKFVVTAASAASLGAEAFQIGDFFTMQPVEVGVCMNAASVVDCVASITITPSTSNISPGGSVQLTATAYDNDGNKTAYPDTLTWTTSSPGLSVSSAGLVMASPSASPGNATVTVTDPLTGIMASATVTVSAGFTVAGSLTGLNGGAQVTLENNGTDPLTLTTNGPFTFSTDVASGGSYDVTVSSQPTGEICTVSNGSGRASGNVTGVQVTCAASSASSYTIGGTLTGLATGASVTLKDNGGDALALSANGTFTFSTAVLSGDTYDVTVSTQPTGQACAITNGSGTATSDVTNVQVTCGPSNGQFGAERVLYSFTGGSDGANPAGGLMMDSVGNLYGTTNNGGSGGMGTVFKLALNSSGDYAESTIYSFTGGTDGSQPEAGVIMDGAGNLYGTTAYGAGGYGTVFKLTPHGSAGYTESTLYTFTGGSDGGVPEAGVIMDSKGTLYGTTVGEGSNGGGTVFKLTPNGSSGYVEATLYNLPSVSYGVASAGGLIMDSAGDLYGTSVGSGGASLAGTVFKLTPNASGGYTESTIYTFTGGSDGGAPAAGVIMDSKGNLYGTTVGGGSHNGGVVFELEPNGSGGYSESVLYNFTGGSDGGNPIGGLVMDGFGNFYGAAFSGGTGGCSGGAGCGVVFKLTPNGTGGYSESVLYTFTGGADGGTPEAGVIMDSANNLFGTTIQGGSYYSSPLYGDGVVYEIPAQ